MYVNIKIIIFLLSVVCNLQASDIHLNFSKITLEDGLTDNRYNNYIFEDSRGFVWIGSIDGLNRYDGMNIKTYGLESGMLGTNIQSNFFEDKKGNLWFSTYEAVNCYNARLDTFLNYQVTNRKNEIVSNNYRLIYLEEEENRLWLLAGNYIYRMDVGNPIKFEQFQQKTDAQFFSVGLNEDGTIKKIVSHLNSNTATFIDPGNPQKSKTYQIVNKNKAIHLQDSQWMFYKYDKLIVFDENRPEKKQQLRSDLDISINDVVPQGDNYLISTYQNGIWLYNLEKEKYLQKWAFNKNKQFSLLTNKARNLYISPSDYLWCSHRNVGVNYSYLYNNNFYNPLADLVDGDVEVTSIIETDEGYIWVSTNLNGVYVFNEKNEHLYTFNHPAVQEPQSASLLQVCKKNNNDVFAITNKSIYQLNLENRLVNNLIPQNDTLLYRYMCAIYPNRHLVSTDKGLVDIKKDSKGNYKIKYCPEFLEHKEYSYLQIYQTQTNKIFIPYNANELWIYQANRDGLKLIGKNDTCKLEFFGFFESKKQHGIVWVGTSQGLKAIDHFNNIKPVLIENPELTNGKVYSVVEDHNGVLWLTTNKGLWKYNPAEPKEKPIHFQAVDGLSGELFSLYHSALYASNGSIWMGNNKGLVVFKPDSVTTHKEVPKLYLENLVVNDTQSFKDSISLDNKLILKYNQNTLTFDIRAVNLYKTKQNKIYYQLENYDKDTFVIKNGEKIRYTKITPGKYYLKVQAEDANGHKGNFEQLLTIEITPPFWQTWWFYALCSLFTFFLVYAFYRGRINYIIEQEAKKREIEKLEAEVLLKEQSKKTELEQLKNQVLNVEMKALRAQMNPHFLFNSLNSIKSLILKTKEKEASQYLNKFATLLRSILNNSEKQKIKLSEEIEALKLYIDLEALRFASDFNYQIQIDKTIDSGFIRIPPLLLQPFVENAIWHGLLPKISGNSKLNINIIRKEDFLFFEIEDNGVGRKKAAALPKKENEKSMGIDITKKRIQLLQDENDIEIIDLVDNNQQALGTKVIIKLFAPE